jgi:hypothetical protein
MKGKLIRRCTAIAVFIAMTGLSGCRKIVEYINEHPGIRAGDYQIKKLAFTRFYGGTDTLNFAYNVWGNPVTILRPDPSTGSPDFSFRYDGRNRLTDMIGAYGTVITFSNVESWNKYFYDAAGRIVKDSLYFFPDVVDGHPIRGEHGVVGIVYYEYDDHNRLSKVTNWHQDATTPLIYTFAYGADGNLSGYTYDSKVNFLQTNKIWMFLTMDYSLNNRLVATYTYNKAGLPTSIDCFAGNGRNFELGPSTGEVFSNATIEYNRP